MSNDLMRTLRSALCERLSYRVRLVEEGTDLRIVMPNADPYGDPLSFVLEDAGSARYLTDAGFLYHHLLGATRVTDPGADLWKKVEEMAARYGFDFNAGEVNTEVKDSAAAADSILNLYALSTEVFGLAHAYVYPITARFEEEVGHFLTESHIPYRAGETIIGSSGAPLRIDFLVANSREFVAQAVASESSMRRTVNIFYDLTEGSEEYVPIAFLDDQRSGYSSITFAQLSHKANVFMWKERQRFLDYWAQVHRAPGDTETLDLTRGAA